MVPPLQEASSPLISAPVLTGRTRVRCVLTGLTSPEFPNVKKCTNIIKSLPRLFAFLSFLIFYLKTAKEVMITILLSTY